MSKQFLVFDIVVGSDLRVESNNFCDKGHYATYVMRSEWKWLIPFLVWNRKICVHWMRKKLKEREITWLQTCKHILTA